MKEEVTLGSNTGRAILALAAKMVKGEILVAEGKLDRGLAELSEAAVVEDAMRYDEPPGWMIPGRHVIGATLMRAKRFAEADRADLKRLPDNGWSLHGLAESLQAQQKSEEEIAATKARFKNHKLLPVSARSSGKREVNICLWRSTPCHSERSRGIPWQYGQLPPRDSLDFARKDRDWPRGVAFNAQPLLTNRFARRDPTHDW